MSYTVVVTEEVEEKLDKKYSDRRDEFASQIDKLEDFPEKRGKPLGGRLHGVWQIRFGRGDRIWYKIDEGDETVTVINLLSKKEAEERY